MSNSQQITTRTILPKILDRISALYQCEIIEKNEKDKMCELARQGISDGYVELGIHLSQSKNENPLYQELKSIITFG